MAHIQKLDSGKYKARYIDPSGKERSQNFPTKSAATSFLDNVGHAKNVGAYVDPVRGRETFGDYAERWFELQVSRDRTLENKERILRVHLLPAFGKRQLASIRPSDVQSWIKKLSETHAPNSVRVIYRQLVQISTMPCVMR